MILSYYYNEQIRSYIKQFATIFAGLQVATGKGEDGTIDFIPVPVRYGSIDKVAAAVQTGNTQNKPIVLPIMSCYMLNIELAPDRRKGTGMTSNKTYMPTGGVFPDDLKVNKRVMPIPYNLTMELALYASNTDQLFQILEQILLVFDPDIQIQKSDAPFDWARLTTVHLDSIQNEENYPMGTDRRMIVWTFNFSMPIWLSPPMDIKNEVVHKVIQRLGNLDGFALNEYDENGGLQPFSEVFGTSETTIS